MNKISEKEIKHLAQLADIKLDKKEIERYSKQLSIILDYVSHLKEVNTRDVDPTSQTTGLQNIKREDRVKSENSLEVKDVLSGTDETYNNYFKIDSIYKKE